MKKFVLVLVCITLFSITGFAKGPSESSEVKEKGVGIGVSRTEIINFMEKPALGFSFEKGLPIEGQECYVGKNEKRACVIQVLGPNENLSQVSITALLGSNPGENLMSLLMVLALGNFVDCNSFYWIMESFQKVADYPSEPFSISKIFTQNKYKISFQRSELFISFILIITPKKP